MPYLTMPDSVRLYYEEEGSGHPVIMVHGWKASCEVYDGISARLKSSFRCIRYDQRGHKRSEVPAQMPQMSDLASDLATVIHKLCPPKKPTLIGWSMGGATLLEYVKQYGDSMIDRMIIVDVSPRMINDDEWKLGRAGGSYTAEKLSSDLVLMKADFPTYMREYYLTSNPYFKDMTLGEQQEMIAQRLDGYHPVVLTSLWESLCNSDYRSVLPAITVPVAVFHASIMPSCLAGAARYYAEHMPGWAYTVRFENASHALITEYPDLFSQEVRKFISYNQ